MRQMRQIGYAALEYTILAIIVGGSVFLVAHFIISPKINSIESRVINIENTSKTTNLKVTNMEAKVDSIQKQIKEWFIIEQE